MRKAILVVMIAILFSAVMAQADDYYVKHKGDKRVAEAVEGMATIYVFRPAVGGGAIRTWAFADDQLIGVMRGRGYSIAHVTPGTHLLWSKAENVSALEVEVEAGKTYYFKQSIRMGVMKARVKMVEASEEETKKYFKKCSFCESTEAAEERAAEIVASRMDTAIKKAGNEEEDE